MGQAAASTSWCHERELISKRFQGDEGATHAKDSESQSKSRTPVLQHAVRGDNAGPAPHAEQACKFLHAAPVGVHASVHSLPRSKGIAGEDAMHLAPFRYVQKA